MGLDIQPSVEQAIQGSDVRLVSIFVDKINQNAKQTKRCRKMYIVKDLYGFS
jgi:hypothetical protein